MLLSSAVALVGAEAAVAGTVSVSGETLSYEAAGGEANDVIIVMSQDRTKWTLTETGASLTVGAGCSPGTTMQTASCAVPEPFERNAVRVELRDGDDRAALPNGCRDFYDLDVVFAYCTAFVRGGSGDDRLVGKAKAGEPECGFGTVLGGPGDDRLSGLGTVSGGLGSDVLHGVCQAHLDGGQGPDTLRGSGDPDVVAFYAGRENPVAVTLDGRRNDGEAGEGDLLIGIRAVAGGSGDDRLVGNARRNTLTGGPGDDVVRGAAGADSLFGESPSASSCYDTRRGRGGADRLFGGLGRDEVLGCGGADRLQGGYGRDRLSGMAGRDVFRARDGVRDEVKGGRGSDRARIDRGFDRTWSVERIF